MEIKNATPLTPPSAWAELYFQINVNNIQFTVHKDQNNKTMMLYGVTFHSWLAPHLSTKKSWHNCDML